jgi:hypothetical protein
MNSVGKGCASLRALESKFNVKREVEKPLLQCGEFLAGMPGMNYIYLVPA